jgi:hypothetical protein
MMPTPWIAPGVSRPPMRAAKDAGLEDEAPVVGVVVAGKARAYSLAALSHISRHVVNDRLGDVPVTVTYCDLYQCLRIFTDEGRTEALELSQGGRGTDGLVLLYGGTFYNQSTGERTSPGDPLPLRPVPHEQTTWKAWRAKHPETDVYTGP